MKKLLQNFLLFLLTTILIPSFNATNSYAQNFSIKLESQPVCLNSLKSVWQEFASPFPCFTSGSLIELSKPVPGRDKIQGDLYFKLNEVVKLVSSPNLIVTPDDYNLGLNKAYFYTKDLSTNEEKLFGSPSWNDVWPILIPETLIFCSDTNFNVFADSFTLYQFHQGRFKLLSQKFVFQ